MNSYTIVTESMYPLYIHVCQNIIAIFNTINTHLVNFCSQIRANNLQLVSGNWSEPYFAGE